MWKIIVVFCICQLINVILSTLKSVITIKGGKGLAAISNAVAYGFNTIVIKVIADVDMWIAVIISICSNLIGVYFALWLTEKMRKDQLWKITVTVPADNYDSLISGLKEYDISFISYETSSSKYRVLDVFSKHKKESKLIRNLFNMYDAKYTILANNGTL
ncbi:MAG TPA: hypothetical protein DD621_04520 [Clostridiales bacterium]|nr:hypothetical protein [Clostridiales bacterium]